MATTSSFKKESVIRGHHVYKHIWTPVNGEMLPVKKEENNSFDKHAVAVLKDDSVIVGHVPKEYSRIVSYFLHQGSQLKAEVIGKRKLGKRLEVPCTYTFTGKKKLIDRLEQLLKCG